ncbi:LADA_0C03180g1_1 [Lachancea dasiensis]|uniref:LADA_0C03180g1_1 n=1 Tax=Lachancea dasiensis TaxID=1072105 RepID=A0A1G4IY76_9SACH|nr:LADA_0C03180g1_1 [Lachancea dasiensis]
MLTFGSRRFISSFQRADGKLAEFYKYHATRVSLRPWIYRPRNANTLLAMDLKEPGSDTPLKSREPVKPLSRRALNTYIWSAQEASQLLDLLHKWTSLTTRKKDIWKYFTADHIQNILFASTFKLGKLSSFLKHLYLWKPLFAEAQNASIYDIEHFFNSVVTCQLHRNHIRNLTNVETAQNKLLTAWQQVSEKQNHSGLASHLVNAFAKQQGFTMKHDLPGLSSKEIELPAIDTANASNGKLSAFLSKHRFQYVMTRTIAEFGEALEPVGKFNENYQKAATKLGRADVYEEYKNNAKHLAVEPTVSATAAPHPAAEE